MRKNNSGNRAPAFSFFHVVVLLLAAVLVTAHLTGGLDARYFSSTRGSNAARVAKFDISAKPTDDVPFAIKLEFLDPTKHTDSIAFTVTSKSEVAATYDVILVLPETVFLWVQNDNITVQMDGAAYNSLDADARTVTFTGKTLGITENTSFDHTITFRVNSMPNEEIKLTENAILRIHAEQVD